MPGTVKSELLPDADRLHKCDGQEKVCELQHLPLDKSHFISGFYVCQYIPDHFLFNSDSSGKKFFSCIFCIGKWSGKDTDASVVSKIIAVKDNVCSVWIFKSFFRF